MKYIVALIIALSLYLLLTSMPLLDNISLYGVIILICYLAGGLFLTGHVKLGKLNNKAIGWGIIIGTSLIVVLVITIFIVLAYSYKK